MRITTKMISSQYYSNLNSVTNQLNKSATTAYDFRAFEKPSENPFLAGQTFQVRRQMALNDNYASNIENLMGAASSADSILQNVSQILTRANSSEVLAGINGTYNQSDRDVIADQLLAMRDAIIADMNAQYGNRYLFAGAGGSKDAPFSVDDDGNLLYRGINVNTGENINGASATITFDQIESAEPIQINFGTGIGSKLNDYKVNITTNQPSNQISVDASAKSINIDLQTGATKQDLQDLLQGSSFLTELSAASATDTNLSGITADGLSQITISGIDEPGVKDEVIGAAAAGVTDGKASIPYLNGSGDSKTLSIDFGEASSSYNGYSIYLSTVSTSPSVSVDKDAQTITISLPDGATQSDLESLLQTNVDGNITVAMDSTDQIYENSTANSPQITNIVSLDDLANETSYVDIGLGMKTDDDGNVIDQSAFDASMPGIKFLGYGTTTIDGVEVPKNICSLLGKMADILKDDSLSGETLVEAIQPYMETFNESQEEFTAQLAHVGTNVNFLESIDSYITTVDLNLTKRDESVEFVDAADAITNYSMQMFSYQATLQVGSNILQPTLLDFMK
ncbi:MAG: Flagellin [Oscillospiraceae bacterium]|jgi:flagellin-like hook-associated protein FlgL